MNDVSGMSGVRPLSAGSNLSELSKDRTFGSHDVRNYLGVLTRIPERDRTDNQLEPTLVSKLPSDSPESVAGQAVCTGKGVKSDFPPGAVQQRIKYLSDHNKAIIEGGLIDDNDTLKIINQISPESSGEERSGLLKKLVAKVNDKHGEAYEKAKIKFPQKKGDNREVFLVVNDQINLLNVHIMRLKNQELMDTPEQVKNQLGLVDAMYTMLIDGANIIDRKLSDSINIRKYRAIAGESAPIFKTIELDESERRVTHDGIPKIAFQSFVNCSLPGNDVTVKNAYECFSNLQKLVPIWSTISAASAKSLKEYLALIDIDRLLFPMSGAGYFAAQMQHVGMTVSCSDFSPPAKRFIQVHKSGACNTVEKYAIAASSIKRGIAKTALLIDAPGPLCYVKENGNDCGLVKLTEFLPKLLKRWCELGGRKVIIVSEAADEELILSTAEMKKVGIRMKPVEPGFSVDIYQGMERYIGVCGVYEVSDTNTDK